MTKNDMIDLMVYQYGFNRVEATCAVKVLIESLSDLISRGNRIEIRGFGSFKTVTFEERVGRNPRTGQKVLVPKRHFVRFRCSKNALQPLNKEDCTQATK